MADRIESIDTPALLLNRERFDRNVARLKERLEGLGVRLRPHMKTAKSVEVLRLVAPGPNAAITVSSLKEAEVFAGAGARDILYAVGLAPAKIGRVRALRSRGVDLSVIVDSVAAARALAESSGAGGAVPALIEIDVDGHRAGVRPDDGAALAAIGSILAHGPGSQLRGVMTHAGGSYGSPAGRSDAAEGERAGAVAAAAALRATGLFCPVVSVGSTPTAHAARDLTGVTEVRAGVFMFGDLVMAGLGVLQVDDVAIDVLATVIGHQREKGWIIVDAGWMAMSRDRGTASHAVDYGYGLACSAQRVPFPDLVMIDANQEHGILALRPGSGATLPDLPIGAQIRILPNHACATAAQHDRYHVTGNDGRIEAVWPRFNGW